MTDKVGAGQEGVAAWAVVGPEAAARMLQEVPPEDLATQAVGDAGPPLGEVLRAIVEHGGDIAATLVAADEPWLDDILVRMPEPLPDWEREDDDEPDDQDLFEVAAEAVHERLIGMGVEAECPPYEITVATERSPGHWYSLWWD